MDNWSGPIAEFYSIFVGDSSAVEILHRCYLI